MTSLQPFICSLELSRVLPRKQGSDVFVFFNFAITDAS